MSSPKLPTKRRSVALAVSLVFWVLLLVWVVGWIE
jgi:hypothetical protein